MEAGSYDLGALLVRIEYALRKVNATRLSIDSIGSIFTQLHDSALARRELFRVIARLKKLGVTAIVTTERTEEYVSIARFGVEEFVADNVVILRNVLDGEHRRHTVEILKFRGPKQNRKFWISSLTNRRCLWVKPAALSPASFQATRYS
jgi:circadian clock protein KaiC